MSEGEKLADLQLIGGRQSCVADTAFYMMFETVLVSPHRLMFGIDTVPLKQVARSEAVSCAPVCS